MSDSKIYLTTKDYLVSGESFDLLYDPEKELLFTSPKPPLEKLGNYYESTDYISHSDESKGLVPVLYQLVKKWSLRKKTRLIRKLNDGTGSLLDVGAGTGDFLKEAKKNGWEVAGTEPNERASTLAKNKGILLKKSLDQFNGKQFDVITLWHVLEHIHDLDETVGYLSKLIKANGTLIIAVPNFNSFDAKHYGKFWAGYDVPRHLWHFSKSSIEKIFNENFRLEKIKPMFFDSFYVSLLSEKYKTGSSFSFKACLIGLVSNLKAIRSKEYSSHIYCLRKVK